MTTRGSNTHELYWMAFGPDCMKGEVPHSVTLSRGLGEGATVQKERRAKELPGERVLAYKGNISQQHWVCL